MKATDLMLDDWVLSSGKPIRTTIAVLSICDGTNFKPIPITKEILYKNGFKNDALAEKSIIAEGASNDSVILISDDNRIMLNNIDEYLNSFNDWHVHIDTEDMSTMCTAEITYVHELQHLLKLCKIEKEIVL